MAPTSPHLVPVPQPATRAPQALGPSHHPWLLPSPLMLVSCPAARAHPASPPSAEDRSVPHRRLFDNTKRTQDIEETKLRNTAVTAPPLPFSSSSLWPLLTAIILMVLLIHHCSTSPCPDLQTLSWSRREALLIYSVARYPISHLSVFMYLALPRVDDVEARGCSVCMCHNIVDCGRKTVRLLVVAVPG
jgi:hypothetical protein